MNNSKQKRCSVQKSDWLRLLLAASALWIIISTHEAAGATPPAVSIEKWQNLGEYELHYGDGRVEHWVWIKVMQGTMDLTGKVNVTHTYESAIEIRPETANARAFLTAAPDSWFLNHPWFYWDIESPPPPLGYNLPRGLQVLSSHEHDQSSRRYDVVGPVKSGTLKFQMEPQDVVCREIAPGFWGFELEVYVLSSPVPLTIQWFRLLPNGVKDPMGIPTSMIGIHDSLHGILANDEASRTYLVEISDGSKTITSRAAKVLRRAGGHEDIVSTSGGNIRGSVWHDSNLNDVDDGEPGVKGIEVALLNASGRKIIASATTDLGGAYAFHNVPPGSYRVNWRFSENYHVARPYIGGDASSDCDAEFASSLINAPTSGPISQDSGLIEISGSETVNDIDLGLFEKPKLTFTELAEVAIEGDSDILIEVAFKLSKPLRYTPLTLHFKTWSQPRDGATRLVDYRQENVSSTTIPAGETEGFVRFTIVGDNLTEAPMEHFFIEPDQLLNKDHIFRVQKPSVHHVAIVDDDVKLPDPKDVVREYKTGFGNRILTGGTADFSTGAPLFFVEAPEIAVNGLPAFKAGPANGLIAHAVLTAPDAKGPRNVSFDWKFSGGPEDVMMVFTQDLNTQYDESNAPEPIAMLSGVTGWQSVSFAVPEGHVINLNMGKLTFETNSIEGWIRNLDLGGPDSPDTAPQPEALALDGLEEAQEPAPKEDRALGVPSQNSSGVYAGVTETSAGGADQAGGISNLSVSAKGAVTGKAVVGGKAVKVRGSFDELGKFSTELAGNNDATATLLLQMQTEVTSGAVEIAGTLLDDAGNGASLTAQKPVKWIKNIHPCPYEGRYSLILPQRTSGAPHLPTGEGFAAIVIGPTGKVTFSGVLGDGTPFTVASSITPAGRIPLQKRLYGNKGSLSGILQIRDMPGVSDLDGKLRWVKPANPKAKLHKDGFDTEVTSLGSIFNPAQRPPFDGLTGAGPWLINVELSGGDFIKAPIGLETQLSVKGKTATLREKAPPQGQKAYLLIRGKASLATGAVSFTYEDKFLKKKVTCRGLIFQKQNTLTGFISGKAATGSFVAY